MFYAYMLRCSDGSIYSGYTNDIDARIKKHNLGLGAKYTRSRRPVTLVYYEVFESKSEALKREAEYKKLSRSTKEEMISGFSL